MRQKYSKKFIVLSLISLYLLLLGSAVSADEPLDVMNAIQSAKNTGVSEETLNHLLALGVKHDLKATEVVQLVNVIRDAKARDLPSTPLVSKMEEGLTKRARISVIEQVARQEMEQSGFVREIAHKTMNRWGIPTKDLKDQELVRMTRVLSMGISRNEMKGLLENAPKASTRELVNSVEFSAALKQAGLSFEITKEVAVIGLQKGFFSKTAWALALTVNAAKKNNLTEKIIQKAALEVVRGEKSLKDAQNTLGINRQDLLHGSYITAPRNISSPPDRMGAGQGESAGGPADHGSGSPDFGGGGESSGGAGGASGVEGPGGGGAGGASGGEGPGGGGAGGASGVEGPGGGGAGGASGVEGPGGGTAGPGEGAGGPGAGGH
ncbi:hypothetical protein ACFL9T_23175 [Thermodesulfobacteriota bacterium]